MLAGFSHSGCHDSTAAFPDENRTSPILLPTSPQRSSPFFSYPIDIMLHPLGLSRGIFVSFPFCDYRLSSVPCSISGVRIFIIISSRRPRVPISNSTLLPTSDNRHGLHKECQNCGLDPVIGLEGLAGFQAAHSDLVLLSLRPNGFTLIQHSCRTKRKPKDSLSFGHRLCHESLASTSGLLPEA